jgi:hypothetical protein
MFSSFKGEKKIHQKILKYNRGKSSFYKAMGKKKKKKKKNARWDEG